jgi:galactokinase
MSTGAPGYRDRIEAVGRARYGPGWKPSAIFQAPGRIELIGNHLDYNGGPVLAAAINRGIAVGLSSGASHGGIRAHFADLGNDDICALDPPWSGDWQSASVTPEPVDFLRGVVTALTRRGYAVRQNADLVVTGDLPHGIGISSSAALCVVLTLALAIETPPSEDVVLIAQEAEHRVGSPCGTMDQTTSVAGGLIRYDGASGSAARVASNLDHFRLVVVNSGIVRSLATSAYPERVREANRALHMLREDWRPQLTALAAIEMDSLQLALEIFARRNEPVLAKRVQHIVTESDRVRRAVEAISRSDWQSVGRLMYESGQSSAHDYEISHPAVEQIVSICMAQSGVLGARMMGGGQGGSALVLVTDEAVPALGERLDEAYFQGIGDHIPLTRSLTCTFAGGAGPVTRSHA